MRKIFQLVKTILVKPAWVLIGIVWWIFGNLLNVIPLIEIAARQDLSQYEGAIAQSPFFHFLSLYWLPTLVIIYLLVIIFHLSKIVLPRLGDVINADLNIQIYPRHKAGYASVKVSNNEYDDLIEPELSYLELYLVQDGNMVPTLDKINPDAANISWGIGGQENVIRGKKSASFNLAKQEMLSFYFLFDNGSTPQVEEGIYKAVIAIDGKIGKDTKKIISVTKTLFLEFLAKNQKYYIDIRETEKSTSDIESSEYGGPPVF